MRELMAAGKLRFVEGLAHSLHSEDGRLKGVHVKDASGELHRLDAEHLLVFFGLAPKLGPIADWGLEHRQARHQGGHGEIPDRTSRACSPSATSIPTRARRN